MEPDETKWDAVEEAVEMLQTGDVEDAVTALSAAAQEEPDNEYVHFFLGQAWFEKKSYDKALACYVRALELKPRYPGAMIAAGHTLRMLGDHQRAMRMGQQALALNKDDPDALYLLGVVHFQRGEEPQARLMLERFLETGPEIEVALEVEGMLQTLRGEVAPA